MKLVNHICIYCFLFVLSINQFVAQSQEIQNLKSENVIIKSDYLDLKIETWDKDYIELKSEVKINFGNDDDKHELTSRNTNSGIEITSSIDTENIDKMVITTDKDGNKSYISMDDWDDSMKGKEFDSMNFGYEINGSLTVYIPVRMNLKINTIYGDVFINGAHQTIETHSTYGLIEAKLDDINKMKLISLKSTYDIVDLTLDKNTDASINLYTSYGSVYTDLPLQTKQENKNKHNHDCGHHLEKYVLNDGLVDIDLVATYDNIYVRSNQ